MAKRQADRELNSDNWDNDEPEEEAGTFRKASADVLAKRVIKVARRRPAVTTGGNLGPSVFKDFGGFGASAGAAPDKPSFLGAAPPASAKPFFSFGGASSSSIGGGEKKSASPAAAVVEKAEASVVKPVAPETPAASTTTSTSRTNGSGDSDASSTASKSIYLNKLKQLNEGVLMHIKSHIEKNVYINLTPVFTDYTKYFAEMEKEYKPKFLGKPSTNGLSEAVTAVASPVSISSSKSIFGNEKPFSLNKAASPEKVVTLDKSPASIPEKSPSIKFPTVAPSGDTIKPFSFSNKSSESSPSASIFGGEKADPKPAGSGFSFGGSDASKTTSNFSFLDKSGDAKPASTGFSFASKSEETKTTPAFSFGKPNESKPSFSFGNKDSSTTSSAGFSFGKTSDAAPKSQFSFGSSTSSGFSFAGGLSKTSSAEPSKPDAEESEEPPKPEVVEFKEEGSVYDKRCKLFYKKDGNFVEKGVGTLFLKSVPDSDKTQLLVRAATTLGNVLLNIILNSSMPVQKTGKNNVLIVCVPNPPLDPSSDSKAPATMLIRVKTSEDADELLEKIKEMKGAEK